MKSILNQIGQFITDNTKDPLKSPAHFIRCWATYSTGMTVAGFFLYPLMSYLGYTIHYNLLNDLIILSVSIFIIYLSNLFIKK